MPLAQTTFRLTMLNPCRLAVVFDFWGFHCPNVAKLTANDKRKPLTILVMRAILVKLWKPKRCGFRRNVVRVARCGLFMAKGDHGVDAQRAAGRKVAGENSNSHEQEDYAPER